MDSKKILSISFLIIALSIAYYFVYFLPNKYKAEQEFEAEKFNSEMRFKAQTIKNKEDMLWACITDAYNSYKETWDANCKKLGKVENDKCTLPLYLSNPLDKDYKETQELCVKKYKD